MTKLKNTLKPEPPPFGGVEIKEKDSRYLKKGRALVFMKFKVFRSFDLFKHEYQVGEIRMYTPDEFSKQSQVKSKIHSFFKDLLQTEVSIEMSEVPLDQISTTEP